MRTEFSGAGYRGTTEQIHVNIFEAGPMPPRARLFSRAVIIEECEKFQATARQFLVNQEWNPKPVGTQELIPEAAAAVPPEEPKAPMEVLTWFCGFVVVDGLLMFRAEIRTSEKLPAKARKLIGETLSRGVKALTGVIERRGGTPGDIVPLQDIAPPVPPADPPATPPIPEIP